MRVLDVIELEYQIGRGRADDDGKNRQANRPPTRRRRAGENEAGDHGSRAGKKQRCGRAKPVGHRNECQTAETSADQIETVEPVCLLGMARQQMRDDYSAGSEWHQTKAEHRQHLEPVLRRGLHAYRHVESHGARGHRADGEDRSPEGSGRSQVVSTESARDRVDQQAAEA
ncbi:MAG: hypothetical protein WBV96_12990 [Polyangia bacterium]